MTAERRHDIIKRNGNNLIPYLLQDSAEYKKLDLEGNIWYIYDVKRMM